MPNFFPVACCALFHSQYRPQSVRFATNVHAGGAMQMQAIDDLFMVKRWLTMVGRLALVYSDASCG